jgi:hypothetical protein
VLGVNPLTNKPVAGSAADVIGGIMKFIGEAEVWVAIQTAKAIDPAWAWIQTATRALKERLASIAKSLSDPNVGFFEAGRIILKAFWSLIEDFKRWAGAAVWELLKIVFEAVKPGITPFFKQAGDALKLILKHPIEFVKNLAAAAKDGFINFGTNFVGHLKEKLLEWLTGAMPGVYVPKAFSLREILKFAFDVMHIGWQFIRRKLVGAVGEPAVAGMEHSHDLVKSMAKDGPAGASEKIKEQVGDVTQTVVGGITSFVVEMVVKTAIPKLISLFVPGAGFVTAIVSIYDLVMVFVQKLATIAQLVKDFLGSLAAIARGDIKGAAGKIESTLKGVLAIAITFFARFVGVNKISDKVMAVLAKIRAPIEKAIDAVVKWIVAGAKKLGKLGKAALQAGLPADPKERLGLGMDAALKVVNRYAGRQVGKQLLMPLLAVIRERYGFSVLDLTPINGIWSVHGKINPGKEIKSYARVPTGRIGNRETGGAIVKELVLLRHQSVADAFAAKLYKFKTPTNKASGKFEVEQTGGYNYRVPAGNTTIDIDGYRGLTILEAKFVEKPLQSPYIGGTNVPPFLRDKILMEQQSEFMRFKAAIDDKSVPFNRLRIVTNDAKAVPYFKELMTRYKIIGEVKVVRTKIPQKS